MVKPTITAEDDQAFLQRHLAELQRMGVLPSSSIAAPEARARPPLSTNNSTQELDDIAAKLARLSARRPAVGNHSERTDLCLGTDRLTLFLPPTFRRHHEIDHHPRALLRRLLHPPPPPQRPLQEPPEARKTRSLPTFSTRCSRRGQQRRGRRRAPRINRSLALILFRTMYGSD